MKLPIPKEVKLLTLSFLLIFLGFNGVQQFITTFFSNINLINIGFQSLILIYLFFILFNPLSAIFVSKYGAKKCMIISSIVYSIFILLLLSKNIILIYIGSSLLGIAASLLWTGQNTYLIRASDKKFYGKNSGFFNSFLSLGSALGILSLGFLISIFDFRLSFIIFSIFPVLGFIILFRLNNLTAKPKPNQFKLIKKAITSITALKLSCLWFTIYFIFGLVIGIIPLEIKKGLGISYIGIFSSLFYILPILLSYFFGKISDIKGRKKMIIFSYFLIVLSLISLLFSKSISFLVLGIILIALTWTIMIPIISAFVGDIATETNLEFLVALFWMIQNIGVVSALFLSQIFKIEITTLYLISIFIVIFSFMILLPLFRLSTEEIKEKISQEMN